METVFTKQYRGCKELLQNDKKKINDPIEILAIYGRAIRKSQKTQGITSSEMVKSAWKQWKGLVILTANGPAEKEIFTNIGDRNVHFYSP